MPTIQNDENKGANKDGILLCDLPHDKDLITDDYIPIPHVEVKTLIERSPIDFIECEKYLCSSSCLEQEKIG